MTAPSYKSNKPVTEVVTIVGGGLSGLAAGCALSDAGYQVQLLERRPYVGGRASSYEHPGTGEVIDNCQHILLGCCTNLIDLYRRLGAEQSIGWHSGFTYIEPGGRRSRLAPSALPAPMHTTPSFLRAAAFSARDKLSIARGLSHFFRAVPDDSSQETFAGWCVRHKQTPRAIKRFWEPILASALNEDLDNISVHYAGKVFRESFLGSAGAGRMGIPRVPLSELYGRAVDYIRARNGQVHLRASVDAITPSPDGKGWLTRAGDREFPADKVILSVAFEGMQQLLPMLPSNAAAATLAGQLSTFEHSPITGIHLWFDREITELEHAVLLDTTIQWMYQKSKLQPERREGQGSYLELVVSASRRLVPMQRQEIIDLALRELALFFPKVKDAKLLKAAVVKEVRATYSVRPLLDRSRPTSTSPWQGIYLAGDWTATGWPATMEGAVRSGYLAAEAMARDAAAPQPFLVPDLRFTGLMKLF
jgi:zeta-carotene desaturase